MTLLMLTKIGIYNKSPAYSSRTQRKTLQRINSCGQPSEQQAILRTHVACGFTMVRIISEAHCAPTAEIAYALPGSPLFEFRDAFKVHPPIRENSRRFTRNSHTGLH